MTADAFGLFEIPTHYPLEIVPSAVPERAVIQVHWHLDAQITKLFADLGCHIVTLVRHPLDVYVSVVRFCAHEPETALWLHGENGDERDVIGYGPNDDAAIAYGRSARFRSLLSVTPEWVGAAALLRYEEVTHDPATMLQALSAATGAVIDQSIDDLVDRYSFDRLHSEHPHHHAVGLTGGWRDVLENSTVEALTPALRWHLDAFGYSTKH